MPVKRLERDGPLASLFLRERRWRGGLVQSRVLVNAGDSTQRLCMDNRLKLGRVSCVVVTSLAPHNVSGLAGILLSLADEGQGHSR